MAEILPDLNNLPSHVGIIMDGNGRWAKARKQIRSKGHSEGLKNAKAIAKAASEIGIKFLTLYVFSTENWKRTKEEVSYLMNLIKSHLRAEFKFYKENNIRIRVLGDKSALDEDVRIEIEKAEKETELFTGLTICLAINYGGRDEIKRAFVKLTENKVKAEEIDEKLITSAFDFPALPDLDLLIRTGGEKRISNFLLWHCAYAEFIWTDTLWPDYNREEFFSNIIEFQKRTRRFGAVPEDSQETIK